MALEYGVEIVGISEAGSFRNFADRHVGLLKKFRRLIQTQTAQIGRNAAAGGSLENILKAVRGFCTGRVIAVFGCGGDRDRTKRPEMAQIAVQYASTAIFTSDNPRHESPEAILDEMVAGLDPGTRYLRIADRAEAIRTAVMLSRPGDIILVAGKGHETYQIIGDVKHHFDDREEVRRAFETLLR